jgi:hypothetical protein
MPPSAALPAGNPLPRSRRNPRPLPSGYPAGSSFGPSGGSTGAAEPIAW